jgi:hypothetical protein
LVRREESAKTGGDTEETQGRHREDTGETQGRHGGAPMGWRGGTRARGLPRLRAPAPAVEILDKKIIKLKPSDNKVYYTACLPYISYTNRELN